MKIIEPSFELRTYSSLLTPEEGIKLLKWVEWNARISHRTEDKQTDDSWRRFIEAVVVKHGDWSVAEHSHVTAVIRTDRGTCYDRETEVLTRDGWKKFHELTYQSELACLSDGDDLEWHKPSALESFSYQGNLLRFQSSSLDILVTPNHNMWVFDHDKRSPKTRIWKFLPAMNLKNRRYKFTKTANWKGKIQQTVIPAHSTKQYQFPEIRLNEKLTGDLFELLGLWITDGSYRRGSRSGNSIVISQTKQRGRVRISELCEILGLRYSVYKDHYRIDNGRLVSFVEHLFGRGAKTFSASIPEIIKDASKSQILRFLDGVVLGDGNKHKKNHHICVYTSSRRFADDLQELWMKVGLAANIRTVIPRKLRKDSRCIFGKQISYVVSVHGEKRKIALLDRRSAKCFGLEQPYTGQVYCATVPYHRLYVRRNGKAVWCGNTHEIVRHRLGSFTQESTRFVSGKKNYPDGLEFIRPVEMSEKAEWYWRDSLSLAEKNYLDMVSDGERPQEARSVLPNSTAATITMTSNLRNWRLFFMSRVTPETHPDMRRLTIPMLAEFKRCIPILFDDIEVGIKQSISLARAR